MDKETLTAAIFREGVWFPPLLLRRLPILRPYAIRDNACRKGRGNSTRPEEYGFPNADGLFRADNSLINPLPSRYAITGSGERRRIPQGLIAAHAWRSIKGGGTANLNPLTHSFIGNLVWLPREIAQYTDAEGSFGQTLLKAIAWRLFGAPLSNGVAASFIDHVWEHLPLPDFPELDALMLSDVSFFDIDIDRFSMAKLGLMRALLRAVAQIEETGGLTKLEIIRYPPMKLHKNYSSYLPSRLESSQSFLRLKVILTQALELAEAGAVD